MAKLIAEAPDLMLLDEPTNHLDIEAIAWLEARLGETKQAFVTISHDRAFLKALTRATLWIDRGNVRRQDGSFDGFEDWRETVWAEEDDQRHKLNRKIKAEARWAVEGISARRKRNQGRVRALQDLRAERASQISREGTAAMALSSGPKSGRKVIEAEGISKTYGDTLICKDFSLRIMRGDRVAFVGPNGVGKTTMIELLTGVQQPDSGTVKIGTSIELALFDQRRAATGPRSHALGKSDRRQRGARFRPRRSDHGAGHAAQCGGVSQGFPVRRVAGACTRQSSVGRRKGAAVTGTDHGEAVEPAGVGRADQ